MHTFSGIMSVMCPRWLFAATLLHIFLPISLAGERATKETRLPTGCTVTDVKAGKEWVCDGASLQEIISMMRVLGKELLEVNVKDCKPSALVELNKSCFEMNINLRSLTTETCYIEKIAPGTFEQLGKLKTLLMLGNQISVINKETFSGLENLSILDLSGNAIQDVPNGTFGYLRMLGWLNLKGNKISVINKQTFSGLENLSMLELSGNAIQDVPNGNFGYLGKLDTLYLQDNKIIVINKETFSGLENLSTLHLSNNRIRNVQNGAFEHLSNLLVLDLVGNSFTEIDRKLSDMKNLEKLYLGEMTVSSILFYPSYDMLHGLSHLKTFYLTNSDLKYTKSNEGDPSLFFKFQEDTLTDLRLISTRMTNNDLPLLKNLKRLERLVLHDNNLGYILNGSLPKLTRTKRLDLSGNKILYIEEGALSDFNGVMDVSDNNFYCDCKILGFSKWLWKYNISVNPPPDHVLCNGPDSMYLTKVKDYNPSWWQCSPYIPLIALLAIIGFAALLALVALAVSCNRVNFKHWLLERRAAAKAEEEAQQQAEATERSALVPPARLCGISSLPKGKTDAYILYNMNHDDVKRWVDHHIEEKLYNHPMKIKLQWAAGPDYIPLWKQVKEYGLGVKHFLVVMTDDLLNNHWPLMSENCGVENLSKFVLVLWGKKKKDLPNDLLILRCPCIEWPLTEPKVSSLQREKELFWKRVRLAVKDLAD